MSAEAAVTPFAAKLIKLSVPPQAQVEAAEARAREILAQAETQAAAKLMQAEREAAALLARARAETAAALEGERARMLTEHRAGVARETAALKSAISDLIGDAVEKIVGATPAPLALAFRIGAIRARLAELTTLTLRAEPRTLDALQQTLAEQGVASHNLRFERQAAIPPGRVELSSDELSAVIDVARQIETFKALARGQA